MQEAATGIVKRILTNFWSFLFVLSGTVDIVISLLFYSGALHAKGFSLSIFLVCLGVGLAYLSIGILIAVFTGGKTEQ